MTRMEMPNMWLVNNDRLNLHIHRPFKMIEIERENGINENQPGVTEVEDGKVTRETFVHITNIEDREDYWYIGFRPVGKDSGRCGFGYTRLYKNRIPEYGTVAFEDATAYNINTGKRKVVG